MKLTKAERDEIRALLAKLTPGPWFRVWNATEWKVREYPHATDIATLREGDDALFVSGAPGYVAVLLDALDEAEKETDRLRGVVDSYSRAVSPSRGRDGEFDLVDCDDPNCKAKENPETPEEIKDAWLHWEGHSYLAGCSHGQ